MSRLKSFSMAVLAITLLYDKVNAGPMKRLSRMVREVYPEIEPENDGNIGNQAHVCIVGDVVYGVDETVPADQPCLKCRCQPPGVQCETIQCSKKPGCKAIHRPNKCCPDYQCECENIGKIYANGERLEVQPGGECKVCYCRGGEVQCAEVSCYIRKDCEGKRVPGTCCPRYDHCPPIDAVHDRPVQTFELTSFSAEREPLDAWPATPSPPNFTDTVLSQPSNDFQENNKVPDTNDDGAVHTNNSQDYDSVVSKITIQEIIPERKEIPITTPPKSKEHQGTLIIEEATVDPESNSNDLVSTDTDSETDSSEVSEVFQHPPPVLRIGDKLLFLKKGELVPEKDTSSPASVITIIGAEGLERGFEESGEIHEVKIEPSVSTDILENNASRELFSETNDLELKTSESTHILSLVKRKKPFSSTTTTTPQTTTTENNSGVLTPASSVEITESQQARSASPNSFNDSLKTITENTLSVNSSACPNLTDINTSDNISTTKSTAITEYIVKNTESASEQNPAYPPIPEIMSPDNDDGLQQYDANSENTTVDSKILPQVLDIRNNNTLPKNVTHSDWLKTSNLLPNPGNESSLVNDTINISLKDENFTDADNATYQNSTDVNLYLSSSDMSITTTPDELVTMENFKSTEANSKSVESMETSEESREYYTQKNDNLSIISNENASIESIIKDDAEVTDMIGSDKELTSENSIESMEATTRNILRDVEITDNITVSPEKETTLNSVSKDVEVINVEQTHKIKPTIVSQKTEATTYEHLPKPQELSLYARPLIKREIASETETEDVFKDLDAELNGDVTDRMLGKDEEQKEPENVFKELLEETTSPKPRRDPSQPRNRDAETLEKVTNALAQFALRGRTPDSNILGVLSNFFGSQYRYNDSK